MRPPEDMIPDGWDYDDGFVVCPHGNYFEEDGSGPCGCESFLKSGAFPV